MLETELIKLLFDKLILVVNLLNPLVKLLFVKLVLFDKLVKPLVKLLSVKFILFVKFEKPLTILSKSACNASSLWIVALVIVNIETKLTALAFKAFGVAVFKLLIVVAESVEFTLLSNLALIPTIELLTSELLAF